MQASKPIIFLKVSDNVSKGRRLCAGIQHYFEQKKRVLVTVAGSEAAKYVDALLWNVPEESFLPHVIAYTQSEAPVVITTLQENLNQASILFNLSPQASQMAGGFDFVYELLDETHPEKLKLSQQRMAVYQNMGYAIKQY